LQPHPPRRCSHRNTPPSAAEASSQCCRPHLLTARAGRQAHQPPMPTQPLYAALTGTGSNTISSHQNPSPATSTVGADNIAPRVTWPAVVAPPWCHARDQAVPPWRCPPVTGRETQNRGPTSPLAGHPTPEAPASTQGHRRRARPPLPRRNAVDVQSHRCRAEPSSICRRCLGRRPRHRSSQTRLCVWAGLPPPSWPPLPHTVDPARGWPDSAARAPDLSPRRHLC
jgi:hypothetical protein